MSGFRVPAKLNFLANFKALFHPKKSLLTNLLITLGKPIYFALLYLPILTIYVTSNAFKVALIVCEILGQLALSFLGFTINLFLKKTKLPKYTFKIHIKLKNPIRKRKKSKPFLTKKRSILLISMLSIILSLSFWSRFLVDLPKPGHLISRDQIVSTKIYARDNSLLFTIYKNQNRTLIPLEKIPLHARLATVAIEDADFYSHHGISARGILRAILRNTTEGTRNGGSTITQQLVKNALLSPEKTLTRKIKEIILAIRVELTFSKDQILEMYLNEVSFGGSAYGIEEASHLYFGKGAKDLTLAESALLAGLPKAPTTFSPFGANPELAKARQLEVLSRMVQEGFITQLEATEADNINLSFAPQRTDIRAPHFVMYIKQLLVEKFGDRVVEEGGLSVYTTLDPQIQEFAESAVANELKKIAPLRITNGATLITNPKNGEILAMVGSKDYFDTKIDGNFNVTTALRQPGSSIKPVNYAYALESKKYTPGSLISDTPITYKIAGSEPYSPRNYDNRFHGNVTLRNALGSSFNVPAVKILASYGVEKMIEMGTLMGISTWNNPSRYGLSLTLGGGEVKMIDMAEVYGVFANYGERVPLAPIVKVVDYKDNVLFEKDCSNSSFLQVKTVDVLKKVHAAEAAPQNKCGKNILDPRVAYQITDILKDNFARSQAFGSNSLLVVKDHPEVAVKTGTTQNLRDNWAIGYTLDYVVVVWVGNNDNTPMAYVASGITGATPIWNQIITNLLKNSVSFSWEIPQGLKTIGICPWTGSLPCEGCGTKTEYFLPNTEPTHACRPIEKREEKTDGQIL